LIAKTQLQIQFQEQLQSGSITRNQLIGFEFSGNQSFIPEEAATYLFKCLRKIWDGMRYLPYTVEEISTTLSNLTLIFINAQQLGINVNSKEVQGLYESLLTEDYFVIEMAGLIRGASSKALVNPLSIAGNFRQDLIDIVLIGHRETVQFRHKNAKQILHMIPDPKWLFEFENLRELFVKEIIPTQAFLRSNREDNPQFFSPLHISVVSMP